MNTKNVYIIDNDLTLSTTIASYLNKEDIDVHIFTSNYYFINNLDYNNIPPASCILAALDTEDLSGLQLINILHSDQVHLPVVLMATCGDIETIVDAIQKGASHFIEKPINIGQLLPTLNKAIEYNHQKQDSKKDADIRQRLESLSPRQKQVLNQVFEGQLNKTIANRLGISIKTVELHRSIMMEKMQAKSVTELIKMTARLDVTAYAS